jgi:predicted acylesterase/phospholipase RssA
VAQGNDKTAFVFSGGGSLGAIQVGMLRVLLAAGNLSARYSSKSGIANGRRALSPALIWSPAAC